MFIGHAAETGPEERNVYFGGAKYFAPPELQSFFGILVP